MKNLITGLIIGFILGGTLIVWAADQRIILLTSNESPLGTTENPLYITSP